MDGEAGSVDGLVGRSICQIGFETETLTDETPQTLPASFKTRMF